MLTYELKKAPGVPLYEALYRCIREDILTGRLAPGTRLPSKRALATHLEVSKVTVEGAYSQLLAEGYLRSEEKVGYFVESDHHPRPQSHAPAPAEAASFTRMKEQLLDVLDTLTPREEKVLRLRFGLDDGHQRTLEEVGRVFKVTRERIRQIEAKALRKLRHPSRSKKLKDFLN